MGKNKNRNKKCPCNSGLKEKDCCQGKKIRNTSLTFMMNEAVALNGYSMSQNEEIKNLFNYYLELNY